VFGHFSTFKAKFEFYGGKIINNNLDSQSSTDAKYDYIASESVVVGGKTYDVYTARPLATFRKSEERSIVLGGNIMIKDNSIGGEVYNLGLEEGADNRNYKFELSNENKLHKNAEIHLTPLEPKKLIYQVFGDSATTKEEEDAKAADAKSNHGLWSTDWVEGIEEGAVVQNVFKNDLANDPLDGRVVFTALNKANNRSGHTTDYGQIYLEDPNNLISMNFELYDLDKNGNHRFDSQLETQYFSQGSLVQNPLSDDKATMKFSTKSDIRLIDIVGYKGQGDSERFDVWDFDRFQVTRGDNHGAYIQPGNTEINIPTGEDVYNIRTLYAINALTNHRHKICGTPVGVPCNHLDGTTHDDSETGDVYGDNGTENLMKIGRKYANNASDRVGGHLTIEVSTLAQLMYVRQHPEYMYVLTNDLVVSDTVYNRKTDGVINSTSNPIENLKLCLNGYNITINSNRSLASLFGDDCYICNCANKESSITYGLDSRDNTVSSDKWHNYYPSDNVLKVSYGSSGKSSSKINIYGNEKGYININNLYLPSAKNNTLINLNNNDTLNMAYVKFTDIGTEEANRSNLATSLLDIPCDAYISTVSFTNIRQTLTSNPKSQAHDPGQELFASTIQLE
ncbi:MAG: hypothetical protein II411_00670, partial [Lachnospiraceae bacterium]|nr:hypothetical protein [Lachnospiraceae bacterium]